MTRLLAGLALATLVAAPAFAAQTASTTKTTTAAPLTTSAGKGEVKTTETMPDGATKTTKTKVKKHKNGAAKATTTTEIKPGAH